MTSSSPPARHEGLLRRLFEVCGVAPLGIYVCVHVAAYAQVLVPSSEGAPIGFGAPEFRGFELALEALLVWLPWLFHAGYGLWLCTQPLPARSAEGRAERLRVALSRVTAMLSLAFVLGHVLWLRLPIWRGIRAPEDLQQMLTAGLSETWRGVPWLAMTHLLGLGCVAAHLGLGLFGFLTRRELATELRAKRVAWIASTALFGLGAASVIELATGDFPPHFLY